MDYGTKEIVFRKTNGLPDFMLIAFAVVLFSQILIFY